MSQKATGACPAIGCVRPTIVMDLLKDTLTVTSHHGHEYRHEPAGLMFSFLSLKNQTAHVGFEVRGLKKWWRERKLPSGLFGISYVIQEIRDFDGTPLVKKMVNEIALPMLQKHDFDKKIYIPPA